MRDESSGRYECLQLNKLRSTFIVLYVRNISYLRKIFEVFEDLFVAELRETYSRLVFAVV